MDIRKQNKVMVLKQLIESEGISRAELARRCGLTRPTLSSIASEFIEQGFIKESGKGESLGGKRPILLELACDSRCVIGIDLADGDSIHGVLCNIAGEIKDKKSVLHTGEFENILKGVVEVITALMQSDNCNHLQGIGIAVSGIVNHDKSEIIGCSNFDIENKGIASTISEHFSLPVYLENRPNAGALGEARYGKGKPHKNLIYLTSGKGIGSGMIYNSEIFQGSFGGAGEIHNLLVPTGNGVIENLESQVSDEHIVKGLSNLKNRELTLKESIELFQAKDHDAVSLFTKHAEGVGYAAAIIANIINPEIIILGGFIASIGNEYNRLLRNYFLRYLAAPEINDVKLEMTQFGHIGVAYGGATLIIDKIINLEI